MAPGARLRAAFVAALALLAGAHSRTLLDAIPPAAEAGSIHAVLVAGSNGWGNYRHQADVAHAYQILVRGGVPPENVVTIAYDDVALNPLNPYPGKLFNRPGGPDVYAGIAIDYRREEATARNFLGVLRGNASLVAKNEHATGRVLEAGPEDRAFVYYADHGAPGLVGMPSGVPLWANQLHAALRARGAAYEMFAASALAGGARPDLEPGTLVFYLEACESGSMFTGLLDPGLPVYATTAANGEESSWGTYCPTFSVPRPGGYLAVSPTPDGDLVLPADAAAGADAAAAAVAGSVLAPVLNTCLGDLYSVSWMEDAEAAKADVETLITQFGRVRDRTSNGGTYEQGSHVLRFNNGTIDLDVLDDFEGEDDHGSRRDWGASGGEDEEAWAEVRAEALAAAEGRQMLRAASGARLGSVDPRAVERNADDRLRSLYGGSVRSRDADLVPLQVAAARGHDLARAALDAEQARRREVSARALATSAGALKGLLRREGLLDATLLRDVVLGAGEGAGAAPNAAGLSASAQARFSALVARAAEVAAAAARASTGGSDADATVAAAVSAAQADVAEVERREAAAAARDGAASAALSASNRFEPSASLALAALAVAAAEPLPAAEPGAPLVEDWGCFQAAFASWADACAPELRQSDLGLARAFANLCNVGVPAADVEAAARAACASDALGEPVASGIEPAPRALIDQVVGSAVTLADRRAEMGGRGWVADAAQAIEDM